MQFIDYYNFLRSVFRPEEEKNIIPGSRTEIQFFLFSSPAEITAETEMAQLIRKDYEGSEGDQLILENHTFYYPVFLPAGAKSSDSAILLLHGLNERKWDKYLTWAQYLVEQTGKAVILFPTSFHINRGPSKWFDPRKLSEMVDERKKKYEGVEESTFANYMLSERLTDCPERFFLSGLETANDLVSLLRMINLGNHPLFKPDTRVDLFAYSIGGLLGQVLKMANPEGLLDNSKLFLFCAGSVFQEMNGVSKVIMDSKANDRIHHYYEFEMEEQIGTPGMLQDFFHESRIAQAFRSMIAFHRHRKEREEKLSSMASQVYAIGLRDDKVIPSLKILETLTAGGRFSRPKMDILHFDYPYIHEMPFPVKIQGIEEKVNEAFQLIFGRAAAFLAG